MVSTLCDSSGLWKCIPHLKRLTHRNAKITKWQTWHIMASYQCQIKEAQRYSEVQSLTQKFEISSVNIGHKSLRTEEIILMLQRLCKLLFKIGVEV